MKKKIIVVIGFVWLIGIFSSNIWAQNRISYVTNRRSSTPGTSQMSFGKLELTRTFPAEVARLALYDPVYLPQFSRSTFRPPAAFLLIQCVNHQCVRSLSKNTKTFAELSKSFTLKMRAPNRGDNIKSTSFRALLKFFADLTGPSEYSANYSQLQERNRDDWYHPVFSR